MLKKKIYTKNIIVKFNQQYSYADFYNMQTEKIFNEVFIGV